MRIDRTVARVCLLWLVTACACQPRGDDPRAQIEAAIARGVEATRDQDLDAYMAEIPEDFIVRDESGEVITRDELKANVLRDWSIIPKTLSIAVTIDSMTVEGDAATVYTSQRWERLMLQRDGQTTDHVLTTQRHRETWRKSPRGWFAYDVEELGGEVFVNGKPLTPDN